MTLPPLLLDTCVVLSLYASRHFEEILQANPGPFLIAEAVMRESLYIHVVVDGVRERKPITLAPLIESGMLAVIEPEAEEEVKALINYSVKLDEGEAMTSALAQQRGYRIATDEKKTINLIGDQVVIVGTLDLVRGWETAAAVSHGVVQEVLAAIEDRGYVPGATHQHYQWWKRLR